MRVQNYSPATTPKLKINNHDNNQASKPTQEPKERVSLCDSKLATGLLMTGAGFIPFIGVGTNAMGAWSSAWSDNESTSTKAKGIRPAVGLTGTVANLAGTIIGTCGLFANNNYIAKTVGLSLLGVSGLAAATVVGITLFEERN